MVIADELYRFLDYSQSGNPLERYYPEATVVTSGLSKWCGMGGWRLGFARFPPNLQELRKVTVGIASETYSCAPSTVQVAAREAYSTDVSIQGYINEQILAYIYVSRLLAKSLRKQNVNVHDAEGGLYLFLDFEYFREPLNQRGIKTNRQLVNAILAEYGVE